jgi:hypothetical protein
MKFPSLHHGKPEKTPEKGETEGTQVDQEKAKKPQSSDQETESQVDSKKRLYVYCILPADSPKDYGNIGVKDDTLVRTITFKDVAAVVSDFVGDGFEKTDANVLAHQRVVHKAFEQKMGIPVRFGTIHEDENEVRKVLEEGYPDFKKQLAELTQKGGEESPIESTAPTDIIAEILSQSAASAVRIRQLADTLETVRREEYEKGAAKLPEGTAKELLDFLAKAPPGAYETAPNPSASTEQIQTLERRLDTLFEEINHIKDMIATQDDSQPVGEIRKEQEEIKEAVMSLRAFQDENKLTLEKAVSQAIKEQMSKLSPAKQVMLDTAGKEEPSAHPIVVGAGETPNLRRAIQTYARCMSCGAGIVITDRYCPHCGKPNYQGGT